MRIRRLVMLRHGQTDFNAGSRMQGQLDSALTELGRTQAVAAAEVLVQPMRSLGTGMQQARAHLNTGELFAWTAATVCAAAVCQGILSLTLKLCRRRGKGNPS